MYTINLYSFESTRISITIDAFFKDECLVVEGQDIGKLVNDVWGEEDYEYSITVAAKGVRRLYSLFGLTAMNKEKFLTELAKRFNGNYSWSEFKKYLDEQKIAYTLFTF